MSSKRLSYGLLFLRVGTGLALATHGYPKLFGGEGKQAPQWLTRVMGKNYPGAVERGGPEKFSQGLERMEIPFPRAAAYLSGLTEFAGGLALSLGLGTRLITPAIIFNMAVAARKAHWQTGFSGPGGYELAALFAVAAGALWLTGPGEYSVDHLLRHQPALPARAA